MHGPRLSQSLLRVVLGPHKVPNALHERFFRIEFVEELRPAQGIARKEAFA